MNAGAMSEQSDDVPIMFLVDSVQNDDVHSGLIAKEKHLRQVIIGGLDEGVL